MSRAEKASQQEQKMYQNKYPQLTRTLTASQVKYFHSFIQILSFLDYFHC